MLDLQALCHGYNIPIIDEGHHHCHQGWLQIHCPFCTNGTHGWHLGFNLEKGNFNCWRCGSFRVWEVLCKLLGNKRDALAAMKKYRTEGIRQPREVQPRKRILWTPSGLRPMESIHKAYLQKRGFDPDRLADEWDLMGTTYLSGEWNWRIVFPIKNRESETVAYSARTVNDKVKPKYKNSYKEQMAQDPKELLYGIHLVKDLVVVVEGPADVWRLGPGAVATLGMDWWIEQALIIKSIPHRVIVFDPGRKAHRPAQKLAEWLGMYDGVTEIITDLPSDPGSLPQQEANKIMEEIRSG